MLRKMVISLVFCLTSVHFSFGDQFDQYTQQMIKNAVENKQVKEVKEISTNELGEYIQLLNDTNGAILFVESNDHRWCKLLVHPARQKISSDKQIPKLLIEKCVTFKEGTEQAIHSSHQDISLFTGLRFQIDLTSVVPEALGGDLQVTENSKDKSMFTLKTIGNAKMYVLTKPLPLPKINQPKRTPGSPFEINDFNGNFDLKIDGRRFGELRLHVKENGEVTGSFTSQKDGRQYDVLGKIGTPNHSISLTIKYPQSTEELTGFMFTGDFTAIAGTAKLGEREAGFYATRKEK